MRPFTIAWLATMAAIQAYGQGTVLLANTTGTVFSTNSISVGGGFGPTDVSSSSVFYYELLTAPSTVSIVDPSLQILLSDPWSDTGLRGTNTTVHGRMADTFQGLSPNNWPGETQQAFLVVGWSANEGLSWDTVKNELAGAIFVSQGTNGYWTGGSLAEGGFIGATMVGNIESGGGSDNLAPTLLFSIAPGPQGTPIDTPTTLFTVIPEPSPFALVGVSIPILSGLIFRRSPRQRAMAEGRK